MIDVIKIIFGWCYPLFKDLGLSRTFAAYSSLLINVILLCIISYIIYLFFRLILENTMVVIAGKTHTKFDDLLISNKTVKYVSYLIPLLFIFKSVPVILSNYDYWEDIFGKLVSIYIIVLILLIIRSVLSALKDNLKNIPKYSDKPIDSYIQVIMIVLWLFGITLIISKLFNIRQIELLTIFGGLSAIILLIFRDTILGFVASVQVSLNDMVRIGDWVTFEKFGADGDVIEINLATVKVKNFDNTTTTIPTYSLISDSFKNWRGMLDSNGRRIKRHILIKSTSIRFIKEEELENFKKIQLITNYIISKQEEINKYNELHNIDKSIAINGRNLTNLGLFRKYITQYLENHPALNKDLYLLCRYLQPTAHGTPLEIYVFTKDKRFENHEYIIADIFDHIIASVSYFDLEIFELPTSASKIID